MALLENQCKFIEVMIEQEVVEMSTYLKMETLNTLYNEIDDPSMLRSCFEKYGIPINSTGAVKGPIATAAANSESPMIDMLTRREQRFPHPQWTNLLKVKKLLRRILGNFESDNYAEIDVSFLPNTKPTLIYVIDFRIQISRNCFLMPCM